MLEESGDDGTKGRGLGGRWKGRMGGGGGVDRAGMIGWTVPRERNDRSTEHPSR